MTRSNSFLTFVTTLTLFIGMLVPGAQPSARERPTVVIDAGHGGDDAGVVSGDLVEKDLVLRIAFVMAAEFVKAGWDVRLTRDGDVAVAWDDRRGLAEQTSADLLLMLHAMGNDDKTVHGAEIYFSADVDASVRAARFVSEAMESAGSQVVLESKPWPFLASPTVPTVMIELAHMSHPVERRLLLMEDFHRELAHQMIEAASRVTSSGNDQ
jgi:N-acetylmuramoyl-L-alanine amidase